MIKAISNFFAFWYDFIVGDDWQVAVGVVVALAVTFILSRTASLPVWWIAPLAVIVLLPYSIYRATRRAS